MGRILRKNNRRGNYVVWLFRCLWMVLLHSSTSEYFLKFNRRYLGPVGGLTFNFSDHLQQALNVSWNSFMLSLNTFSLNSCQTKRLVHPN